MRQLELNYKQLGKSVKNGDIAELALGAGMVLIIMGIILYTLDLTSTFTPESDLKDYVYSTATNSTIRTVNVSDNQTQYVYLGTLASIDGSTPTETLIVTVNNSNTTDATIGLYINGVLHSNLIATNSSITNSTRDIEGYLVDGTNNVTFKTTVAFGKSVNVTATYWTYPSSTVNKGYGDSAEMMPTYTGRTMQVLFFALVIVILGVGIAAIRGFGKGGQSGMA